MLNILKTNLKKLLLSVLSGFQIILMFLMVLIFPIAMFLFSALKWILAFGAVVGWGIFGFWPSFTPLIIYCVISTLVMLYLDRKEEL